MRTTRMIWHKGNESPSGASCAVCGRALDESTMWAVHVIDGGTHVLHPNDESTYIPDDGDMGCHMLGPECRRKFRDFAFQWNKA